MGASTEQAAVVGDQVRSELARILSSPEFSRSPQLQRLLSFVTIETLAGRNDRLKEYTIGVEVFARPASYDPRLDSLVRVEARRLRGLLEQYYANPGNTAKLRIELPRGSYVPVFRVHTEKHLESIEPEAQSERRVWPWVAGAVAALVIIAGGLWWVRSRSGATSLSHRTIAVLPFENVSSDPENEYLCFGLMDEVTTDLAKDRNLRVIARTSAARFKRGDDIASIARQLKADTILEGSVAKHEDHVRVTAQLISAGDSVHLWAETYERTGGDPLAVQNEVAREIAGAVAFRLGRASSESATRRDHYSSNAEANRFYWKGAYFHAIIGSTSWKENVERSVGYFEQSVGADPQFAMGYGALADGYVTLAYQSGGGPETAPLMQKAREAASKALALDAELSGAYGVLGTVQFSFDYDVASAEKNFKRALEINPSDARTHMWYAMALAPQGRFKESLDHARQARDLDPLSFATSNQLASMTYLSRDYSAAAKIARETLDTDPRLAPPHILLGMIDEAMMQFDKAIGDYESGLRLAPNHQFGTGRLGHALAMANRTDDARKLLAKVESARLAGTYSDLYTAYIYLGLRDFDRVFIHLDRAYERRDPDLPYIAVDPIFDPLQHDPRYRAMLKKLGLAHEVFGANQDLTVK